MTDNVIGDRYVLGPLLGRGGMAEVRRARDTRLERDVAVKMLKTDLAGDPVFQERFRREAHAAAGLNHPNIVSVFDTGESYDEASGLMIPYIVMELVIGHTLREVLHDGRKIQPTKALELTQCVLDALDYSHRHGIIHRDIKPANVMLTNTGQVKVMDFGIARAVSDTAASMTQTASVIGTPQYLSPEQIRGEAVDRRSDLYSTGCLLYELLTGKPPFEGDSPVSLAYQHVRATPVPPSEIDPMISSQMDAIALKALAKNPADRYQTAHEMSEDIGRLLAGQRVQAVIPPPVEDTPTRQVMATANDRTQVMPPARPPAKQLPARAAEPEEEEPSHLGRTIGIVVACMLFVALIAFALVVYFNKNNSTPLPPETPSGTVAMTTVPSVLTMQQDGAISTLENYNLKYKVDLYYDDDPTKAVGTVTAQDPAPQQSVAVGSVVTIRVNQGQQKFPVPNVVDLPQDQAMAKMKETFTNVSAQEATAEGPGLKAGTIVSTDPVAGGMATKDQPITLYYATGQVKLPSFVGASRDSALAMLVQMGFTYNENPDESQIQFAYKPTADTTKIGFVLEQNPSVPPGEPYVSVANDTVITLTIGDVMAESPAPTTPPPTTTTPTASATPEGQSIGISPSPTTSG